MSFGSKLKMAMVSAILPLVFAAGGREAEALEIKSYDGYSAQVRNRYNANLVAGTVALLHRQGRIADAEKMKTLFGLDTPGDRLSSGMAQFMNNIDVARNLDNKNGPNAKRLHIEHALMLTLKQNGIAPPAQIMTVNADWDAAEDVVARNDGKKSLPKPDPK